MAQPTLLGDTSQGGRRVLGSEPRELGDEAEGLGAPAPAGLAGEDAESLRAGSQQLGVGCTFAPLCDGFRGSITRGSRGLRPPFSRQRGHDSASPSGVAP